MVDRHSPSDSPEEVLSALADADARRILTVVGTEPRSVAEITDGCEIPSATAYRKVGRLVDAGLLEERVRLSNGGQNISEYLLSETDVTYTIEGPTGIEVTCSVAAGIPDSGPQRDRSRSDGDRSDDIGDPNDLRD
ncbi:helix-turn-helix domain-containing protein [Halorubrum sp. JWXQ-INN 858]|uniref:ArsR/SmtB family transcription factor n=1 Tax=Halorubrum sp. JWXQ-INN 858 TaxID=2690782 RepID=UPI00135AE437|nr:helix-turn-helix domain-containing protein [Halorubrum sp. JWXQ-INN 858]MWV65504.1 helix-turn-helix domain-containing protein [Halorubrum sp. JWXQ-INN 858]